MRFGKWFAGLLAVGMLSAGTIDVSAREPGGRGGKPSFDRLLVAFDTNVDGALEEAEVPVPVWARLSLADADGSGDVHPRRVRRLPSRREVVRADRRSTALVNARVHEERRSLRIETSAAPRETERRLVNTGHASAEPPLPDPDDACDIAASLSGDGEAYRRLIGKYQAEIGRQLRRFTRDPAARDELSHDVFVEAYLSLRGYRSAAPFLHWLRRIAVRVGYRYWKRQKSRGRNCTLTDEDWSRLRGSLPAPDEATAAGELVHALLSRLSPSDRLVLTLVHLDGRTLAETADLAGWTVVGTKVRVFRARARLRALLEKDAP